MLIKHTSINGNYFLHQWSGLHGGVSFSHTQLQQNQKVHYYFFSVVIFLVGRKLIEIN